VDEDTCSMEQVKKWIIFPFTIQCVLIPSMAIPELDHHYEYFAQAHYVPIQVQAIFKNILK
jgi:predicted alpha-1,6-mannanase (GH76 family)